MTINDTATHNGAVAASNYTPAELSYLLAGRDNAEANRAREILGLDELHEGDASLLTAVQSLRARGLVTATPEGDVDLEQSTKVVGFVLGTGTDWTRLAVDANGTVSALVVVKSPEVENALILRLDEFGNYQAAATLAGVHPSQITGTMVSGYLGQGGLVTVSVRRDTPESQSVLVARADTATDEFTITNRSAIPGSDDVTDGQTVVVDRATYLANLESQLAD